MLFYFDNAHIVNSPLLFYRGNISTYLLLEGYFLMVGNRGIVLCEGYFLMVGNRGVVLCEEFL